MAYCTTSIGDLPDEVFYIIAAYLDREDIDSCFNVCQRWKNIFNSNKIWKNCCVYPEKYLKNYYSKVLLEKSNEQETNRDKCLWRRYYECQSRLCNNWDIGRFRKEKIGVIPKYLSSLYSYLDDHGNHWLFGNGPDGIIVWNIDGMASIQTSHHHTDHIGITPIKEKIITFRSDFIKVFQFSYPKYMLELQYKFIFSMESILPENEVVSEDYYTCSVRHIIVDDIFVGYSENITYLHSPVLHIWNLSSARKIASLSVFQQSFVDYVYSCARSDVTKDFDGGLLLFEGDSDRFLVTLIACEFDLCQISLYSLDGMRFLNVIAQVKSRTAWCFMKENVIAIYHVIADNTSQISLYDSFGSILATLDFPYHYNPAFSGNFWFNGAKAILKVESEVHVLTIKPPRDVCRNTIHTNKSSSTILKFFEPKYLLLCSRVNCSLPISVWDIESGVELWSLGMINCDALNTNRHLLSSTKYPGKLILHLQGDEELSILNFEI